MKVSEPAPTYGASDLQGLKNRLIATIDASTDERKLEQCWELLQGSDMPCVFTDEEFEDFYSEVEEDLKAYNQERADAGLATLGNPPAAGGGKGTGKEDEPFSDKDIEDMANSF